MQSMMNGLKRISGFGFAAILVVATAVIFQATTAEAGRGIDRPDLEDYEGSATATHKKGDTYSRVKFRFNPEPPSFRTYSSSYYIASSAYGHLSAYGYRSVSNNAGFGRFFWWLFEPDSVKRGPYANNEISHNDYVAVALILSTNNTIIASGFSYSGSTSVYSYHLTYPYPVFNCKGSLKVKDADKDLDPEDVNWSINCGKKALDALELSSSDKAALKKIFGSKNSLKAKGTGYPNIWGDK